MLLQRHKKLTTICGLILLILGTLYGTVYILCKIYLNEQNIRELIVSQAQNRLNRTVTVAEDVSLSVDWNMTPHLILHNIVIGNTTWAEHHNLLTIDTLEMHFSLIKIFFKQFHVHSLELTNPKLYLENTDNKNNWDFIYKEVDTSNNKIKLIIDKIAVKDGLLVYNQDKFMLNKFTCKLHNNNMHIFLRGTHNSSPIKATIDLTLLPNKFELEIANLQAGSSDLSGDLSIATSPLHITGKFNSKKLILKDFAIANSPASGEYSISSTPFPIDKLRNSEFDVTANINTLNVGGININNVTINTKNINNVLSISLQPPAIIANGKLNLSLKYDINPTAPIFNLQIKTTTIQLETILKQIFGETPITRSTLDFSANLSGSGNNLNSIVNSMNGNILAVAGPGDFLNAKAVLGNIFANILTSVITYDKQAPSTAFKCGVLNFKVDNGIANAKNGIGIEAASVNVLGNGMIDLRNGRINFSITPQNILGTSIDLSTFSVAKFATITGTINKPEVKFNTMNMLAQSSTALLTAGIAGGLTGGLGTILAGGATLVQPSKQTVSPCKTALGN